MNNKDMWLWRCRITMIRTQAFPDAMQTLHSQTPDCAEVAGLRGVWPLEMLAR